MVTVALAKWSTNLYALRTELAEDRAVFQFTLGHDSRAQGEDATEVEQVQTAARGVSMRSERGPTDAYLWWLPMTTAL